MHVDKYTKIYGSVSAYPGTFGSDFFNKGFEKLGLNAIYRPFKITSPGQLQAFIENAPTFGISGFGVSMPWKFLAAKHVDYKNVDLKNCTGRTNINTIKFDEFDIPKGYNTDITALEKVLSECLEKYVRVYVVGSGAYADSANYIVRKIRGSMYYGYPIAGLTQFPFAITRNNWNTIEVTRKDSKNLLINCTPVVLSPGHNIINARVETDTGKQLALIQAKEQFKIYTGMDYPS